MIAICICLCVLLIVPMWHFVWESIFLPSLRLKMRFRLFAIRDELRLMRISNPAILADDVFHEAERRINISIQMLPEVDPFIIERVHREIKADKALTERIEKRHSCFESKAPVQVLRLTDEASKLGLLTAFANSGGWMIYALPIATAAALFKKLKLAFRELAVAPPHTVEKIVSRYSQVTTD